MIHPHTELRFISERLGYGVFAKHFIPRGTITWVRDSLDRVIDPRDLAALPSPYRELLDKYTFRDGGGRHILCWDLGRFLNHSCAPSCLGPCSDYEVAVRDIRPGEELTDDYSTLCLQDHESFHCHCGASGCRRWITSADAIGQTPRWDLWLQAALADANEVPQPLLTALGTTLEPGGVAAMSSALIVPVPANAGLAALLCGR